jgi:hypothetical protein
MNGMAYKIKYDEEANILTVVVAENEKLSYAEEVGNTIVHFDENENRSLRKYSKQARLFH